MAVLLCWASFISAKEPFKLNVVMLSVVMLSVVAPKRLIVKNEVKTEAQNFKNFLRNS
jgi:hypothetical protein